jgi:hypothetical protein
VITSGKALSFCARAERIRLHRGDVVGPAHAYTSAPALRGCPGDRQPWLPATGVVAAVASKIHFDVHNVRTNCQGVSGSP